MNKIHAGVLEECTSKKSNSECYDFWICWADLWKCGRANLEGANLEGADLKGANLEGVNLEKANLKGTNLEFDDKNFYRLSVGKVDPVKKKIKGAKNLKKAKGAKTTTRVRPKDLVRMCKRKAEAQFRKCAKGSRGGNAGGNFLAHQGCAKQRKKDMLACDSLR